MKDFLKTLLILLTTSSAFLIGFFLGEEKIKSKISNFQEDSTNFQEDSEEKK